MLSGVVSGDIENLIQTNNRLSMKQTRQESQDVIHKQLAAFEKLLQHAMSRFSTENLYHVLKVVTRWAKADEKRNPPSQSQTTNVTFKLRSIKQLRGIVDTMRSRIKNNSLRGSDAEHAVKYHDMFVNDLLYLKDLKKYFTDEIYSHLMRYHYDASVAIPARGTKAKVTSVSRDKIEDNDSGHGSQAEADDIKKVTKGVGKKRRARPIALKEDEKSLSEKRYAETVKELENILKKWSGLLTDDILDLNNFDPDSYHELMQFNNYSTFEPILRLVPDIFAKCYKCIDLSKVWLKESNVVLKDVPQKERTPSPLPHVPPPPPPQVVMDHLEVEDNKDASREFVRQIREVQIQLDSVEKSIEEDEKILHEYTEEMNSLQGRDERFTKVSSDFERIDSLLSMAAGAYQKSKTEQYSVATKLKTVSKGSPLHNELKGKLKKLDQEVSESHWKMKSLEFERSLVTEDYMLEMEVRPSFIRFVGDTKTKIQELQQSMQDKREEKLRLDKQLALMKTNTDRMRKIMRTYLGSASSNVDPSTNIQRKPTMNSSLPDSPSDLFSPDTAVYCPSVDGNDADDDSEGPYDVSPQFLMPVRTASVELKPLRFDKPNVRPQSFHALETESSPRGHATTNHVTRIPQIQEIRRGPRPSMKAKRVWEKM